MKDVRKKKNKKQSTWQIKSFSFHWTEMQIQFFFLLTITTNMKWTQPSILWAAHYCKAAVFVRWPKTWTAFQRIHFRAAALDEKGFSTEAPQNCQTSHGVNTITCSQIEPNEAWDKQKSSVPRCQTNSGHRILTQEIFVVTSCKSKQIFILYKDSPKLLCAC